MHRRANNLYISYTLYKNTNIDGRKYKSYWQSC